MLFSLSSSGPALMALSLFSSLGHGLPVASPGLSAIQPLTERGVIPEPWSLPERIAARDDIGVNGVLDQDHFSLLGRDPIVELPKATMPKSKAGSTGTESGAPSGERQATQPSSGRRCCPSGGSLAKREGEENCPICMQPMKPGAADKTAPSADETNLPPEQKTTFSIPECNDKHKFHQECITQWTRDQRSCPLCRGPSRRNRGGNRQEGQTMPSLNHGDATVGRPGGEV